MAQRGAALIVTCLALALLAAAPARSGEIGFRIVDYGTMGGEALAGPSPEARIVRDAAEARALLSPWELRRAAAHVAAVDFARRSLIVVGGWWPNPGYGILPGSVIVSGGAAQVVGTVIRRPGGHADVVARPWVILSVPRAAVAGLWPDAGLTLRCGPRVRCYPGVI